MKKIFTFGAIALAALATVSCNNEVSVEVLPAAKQLTEVHAAREASATKVTWKDLDESTKLIWEGTDAISVFTSAGENNWFTASDEAYTKYAQDWSSLTFSPNSEVSGEAPYIGVYPYHEQNKLVGDANNNYLQIPFDVQQVASAGKFNRYAFSAVAYSNDANLSFKNVYGLLAIKVGTEGITHITLQGNSAKDAFARNYGIVPDQEGNPIVFAVGETAEDYVEAIYLYPEEEIFVVDKTYFLAVPPTTFNEGVTFGLYSGMDLVGEKSTDKKLSVERNKIHEVPTLTVEPAAENYVSDIVAQIKSDSSSSDRSKYSVKNLAGAVVSYVNGNNVYIEDKSGAIHLYMSESNLKAGDVISGELAGEGYYFNGLPEIVSVGNAYIKTTGDTIPETTITLAELKENHTANLSRRVKVEGVTITDGIKDGDRKGTIRQGEVEYAVYAQINNQGLELKAGNIGDLVLFVGRYNATDQLLFWDNDFFSQTGAVTNLTVSETLTVTAGNTKSISVETNSTGAISFVSDNTAVATVDDKGVVTGVAAGTAKITVSVAAHGFYSAIQKECTVTVEEASDDKEELKATLDFTNQSNWDIPTGGTNKTSASFTDGTYSITLYSTTNYKLNNGYLILGRSGSTLTFPAFTWKTTKIVVYGTSSASESVKQNIFVGTTAVSTETTGAKNVTNTYEIDSDYQAAGTVYILKVTSAHNTQISKIEIYGI